MGTALMILKFAGILMSLIKAAEELIPGMKKGPAKLDLVKAGAAGVLQSMVASGALKQETASEIQTNMSTLIQDAVAMSKALPCTTAPPPSPT